MESIKEIGATLLKKTVGYPTCRELVESHPNTRTLPSPRPGTHKRMMEMPYEVSVVYPSSVSDNYYFVRESDAKQFAADCNHSGNRVFISRYTKKKPWGYFDKIA